MGLNEAAFAGGLAVITGAGEGIGAGLARRAAELDMTVIVTDISESRSRSVADEICKAGGKAHAMTVDVSQPKELDWLADKVFSEYGNVRLLINNAGIETLGFSWELSLERWEQTLNVYIHGVIHGVRAFAPRMLASGEECWIANVSSIGAFGMMPTQTAYMLSKHAVQSFTECLYLEMQLKNAPIHVSSVTPGMLKTQIFQREAEGSETSDGSRYRENMRKMMESYGMDLADGCRLIMDQIASNQFWVSTQPEMTKEALAGRIAFFQGQSYPQIHDSAIHLLSI